MREAPESHRARSACMMGEESLLIQCAEMWLAAGHALRGVIAADHTIRAWAGERGVPVLALDDLLAGGAAGPFDYFFSITNLRMLPPALLGLPRRAAINFHDGPLPRYAGLNAPAWALMRGEREYGITWHLITAEADTGDLLRQQFFAVAPDETSLTLNTKCYEAAIESFGLLIEDLAAGRAEPRAQDLALRTYYGRDQRPRAAAVIDFSEDAERIDALVRALQFGPYANPLALPKWRIGEAVLAVTACAVLPAWSSEPPGTVVDLAGDRVRVATATHDLALTGLATLDGRPLSVAEAAERYGIRAGQVSASPSPAEADRLTALAEAAAPNEPFWVRRLARLQPPDLPYGERGAASGRFARMRADLPTASGLGEGATAAEVIAAAFAIFLTRVTGQREISLAWDDETPSAAAGEASHLFARQAPLRVVVDADRPFEDGLKKQLEELAAVRRRGTYARDAIGRYPALAHLRGVPEGVGLPVGIALGAAADGYRPESGSELTLLIGADGGCTWLYDEGRFEAGVIAAIARQFATFLAAATARPARPVASLPLLDAAERGRVLVEWNATARDYDRGETIIGQFARQVARTPAAVALVCEGESLTYRELDARADRLAARLVGLGVGPDRLVGICIERSTALVVAVLAVGKAGGGYVPLDPAYPADRIRLMLEDSRAPVLLTQRRLLAELPAGAATVLCVDDLPAGEGEAAAVDGGAGPENLAYVIYTSGSTGKPKGVMVEHRNVVNFFAGMDDRLTPGERPVWLAVTSLSFDISVLELLWTLTRGFTVVLYTGEARGVAAAPAAPARPVGFSLFYFASGGGEGGDPYRLLLEGARYADEHGFEAVWTPERHFHEFGGIFPNPSVASAAVAAATRRVGIRAGSVVLPLHSPIRVAEEWAVVDVLSQGRVGISFASGWQPHDFVLKPEAFADAKGVMLRDVETVRRLWRGEAVSFPGHDGQPVPVRTLPRPVQAELPVWLTAAGNPETFRAAGALGAHILTHLLGQSVEEVAEKIAVYRAARREAGHPGEGHVTLMLHTFVGEDEAAVRATVRRPMIEYLRSSVGLIKQFAWSFPTFQNRAVNGHTAADDLLAGLSEAETEALLEHAFERYYETSGLFGTPASCMAMVERLRRMGVDEIGCLIDFGVDADEVLRGLDRLNEVRAQAQAATGAAEADGSIAALIGRHGVSHLQCTPSMATMLVADPATRAALGGLRAMLVGGEAFPPALAAELERLVGGRVINMYGPTETTIWSSTYTLAGGEAVVPIGRPIANTQLYILDAGGQPVGVGVPGELSIGGDGVVRGYLERPELTAERFLPNPFVPGGRIYRTGDLARWRPDGVVEFLGRIDQQVKVRGYRIELGEIESALAAHPGVREAVVVAREDTPGDKRLVAYLVGDGMPSAAELRAAVGTTLPEYMVPAQIVRLAAMPLTPNQKIDRKALPRPETVTDEAPRPPATPPANVLEERIAAVWRDVLGLASVGVDENFFDLGGNSLLIVQVHRRLLDEGDRLSLTDLFRFPTIRALATFLARDAEEAEPAGIGSAAGVSRAEARRAAMLRRR